MTNKELQKILKRIGFNVRHYRKLRGYTQEDMASLGFNYRHFQSIEAGDAAVTITTLARIAHVLKIDIHELLKPVKKN